MGKGRASPAGTSAMRQVICNSSGAYVVRVPRPVARAGTILVRAHFSWISIGTEIAPLRGATGSEGQVETLPARLRRYVSYSIRNPGYASRRALALARSGVAPLLSRTTAGDPVPAAGDGSTAGNDGAAVEESQLTALDRSLQGWNVGYSTAGEVVAVGDTVQRFAVGDRVACVGAGEANHADFVVVRQNMACKVPDGCSLQLAGSAAIGGIALQGVRRAGPQVGETVCVLGLGLIGQITVQILAAAGCRVVGMDLEASRVSRAIDMGLRDGTTSAQELERRVRDLTGDHGVDRTIITAATKSSALVNQAMSLTRRRGTVVSVGDVGLDVERSEFYRKEIDLLMSTSYGPGRYDPSFEEEGHDYPYAYVRWTLTRNLRSYLELIADGRIDVAALLDRVVSVDAAHDTYADLAEADGVLPIGVALAYVGPDRAESPLGDATSLRLGKRKAARADQLRYALVGVGAFGTSMLVPQMAKRKDRFVMGGIVSRDPTRGGNYARAQGLGVFATDLAEILRDPEFDLVVIATRHHEHAAQGKAALQAGKHVFVEKPLALSWRELADLVESYEELDERPLLMVGFNRRFAPAMRRLAECLERRTGPLVMNYRVNAGYIPPDHWIQGAHGGGRNLGEACHFYDCLRYLAGVTANSVAATSIDPGETPYRRTDNFQATIGYEDGSVGTVTYTSMGPKTGLEKERLEVFCDGEAYVLEDYKQLRRAGDGKVLWSDATADKGHFEELSRFGDAIIANQEAPIPFGEIVETSAIALHVEDLLLGRHGEHD